MSEQNQFPQASNSPARSKGSWWKTLLIALAVIIISCLLCLLMFAASLGSFLGAAFLTPTSTARPISSSVVKQVMAVQASLDGKELFNSPHAMGLDSQGNLYSADYSNCHINIFDPGGKYLRAIVPVCEKAMNGMVVLRDGTVFISQDGRILRLDAQGKSTLLPYDEAASGTGFLGELILEKSGDLLAADIHGSILRFGQDGTVKMVVKTPFLANLKKADANLSLAEDPTGNIYALGWDTSYIIKLGPDGKFINSFGGENHNRVSVHPWESSRNVVPATDPGYFYEPAAIAVDGNGRIFVGDQTYSVQIFDQNEKFLESFDFPDKLRGLMVDPSNNLYVATNTPEIVKLAVTAP